VNTIIDIAGLQAGYQDQLILNGVDLQINAGEIVLIVGGSGCGKSTLLKTLVGLLEPGGGRFRLFDKDLNTLAPDDRKALLQRLGVMFQYGALLNSLKIAENIALPLEMHTDLSPTLIDAIVRTRLNLVGLDQAYDQLPPDLSGGMRKRAALARAMALDPEILFCDEPGAGLDPITAAGIDRLLLTLNKSLGTTLVVVTHELLSIERLNGRIVMLDQGKVLFTGTFAEGKSSPLEDVRRFFNPGV
jgi:phospholipid/cholesterol/gamma-HCH transport system ATP-binding protein